MARIPRKAKGAAGGVIGLNEVIYSSSQLNWRLY